ncbi:amino acid ABC transporter permease [Labrys wisconsinensis]|uniref:Polar amino acid transport system permease protein/cystine transport system permease protein n=1 Tax=Labrys wisconsinensis TaxID=425677 RepID=A0ABU0J9D4_9HYPH|nr:amino acid ABC transporter permease [Labrys wisconsinensis]MDQ0470883.1 polar amino acid transport system permease protein/cystine transport system permease protein [Labrys wisconsinensis]
MDFWDTLIRTAPHFLPVLLEGAWVAVQVAAGALAVALPGGLALALLLLMPFRPARILARGYVEVMRGTPALTQLFIIYFGLADLGLGLPPLAAAIVGLGANGAAYLAEVFRAGIGAVHKGQTEAALSLGLPPADVLRFVVLPQAVRIMLPPLCNYAVQLLKDTTLASSVAAPEIMFRARNLVMETYLSMQIYLLVACIYLALSIPLSHLAARLQRRAEGAAR